VDEATRKCIIEDFLNSYMFADKRVGLKIVKGTFQGSNFAQWMRMRRYEARETDGLSLSIGQQMLDEGLVLSVGKNTCFSLSPSSFYCRANNKRYTQKSLPSSTSRGVSNSNRGIRRSLEMLPRLIGRPSISPTSPSYNPTGNSDGGSGDELGPSRRFSGKPEAQALKESGPNLGSLDSSDSESSETLDEGSNSNHSGNSTPRNKSFRLRSHISTGFDATCDNTDLDSQVSAKGQVSTLRFLGADADPSTSFDAVEEDYSFEVNSSKRSSHGGMKREKSLFSYYSEKAKEARDWRKMLRDNSRANRSRFSVQDILQQQDQEEASEPVSFKAAARLCNSQWLDTSSVRRPDLSPLAENECVIRFNEKITVCKLDENGNLTDRMRVPIDYRVKKRLREPDISVTSADLTSEVDANLLT